MKKGGRQSLMEPRKLSFKRMLFSILFVIYAWIIISLYLKQNGFALENIFSMIADYFRPIIQSERGADILARNIVSALYRVVVVLSIVAAGLGFGGMFQKYIPAIALRSELEKVVFSVGIGSFVLIMMIFLLGALHLLAIVPVIIVLAFGIAFAVLTRVELGALKEELRLAGQPLLTKLILGLSALYMVIVFMGTLVPEIFYDSLVYHIAAANWYKLTHGLRPPLSDTLHFFVPGYARLLYSVCLILSDEISAKFLHYFFALLTAVAVFVTGKNRFNRTTGLFAALAFITMPSIGIVGVRSAMETFLCFFEFLSLVFALKFIDNGERKWLIISGVFLGTAIGCKYLSVMSWAAIGLILVIDALAAKKSIKQTLVNAATWNAGVLAAAGAWIGYNVYYTGNPVYPALWQYVGFLQTKDFLAVEQLGRTFGFIDIIQSPWIISMGLKEEAYAGIMFLLFVPVLFFTGWYKTSLKYVVIYAAAYWLMWMNIGPYFYFRYYLPAMPAVCLVTGYAASEFNGKAVRLAIFVVIAINAAHVASALRVIYYPVDYIKGSISKSEYLSSNRQTYPNPYYPAAAWINANLENDARILLQGEERAYYLERQYVPITIGDRNYLVTLLEKSIDMHDLARLLRQHGITHILLNVPEARRLKGYDIFHFEPREFGIFNAFWDRYVKEVHRGIADITLLQRGIFSMKQQQPQWWQQYASDEGNYVYVYEILSDDGAARPHAVPHNFLKDPSLYPDARWKKLAPVLQKA